MSNPIPVDTVIDLKNGPFAKAPENLQRRILEKVMMQMVIANPVLNAHRIIKVYKMLHS